MTVTEFFTKLNNGATWSAGVSFKRAAALPLERYAVHASYEDAASYASDNPVAYPGQIIAVVETTATNIYYIDQNMALQPVGTLPTGDDKTISIDDNGVVSLYGIDGKLDSAKSYQPVYKNGALTWIELSSTTVEGLQALIETLRADVDALEAKVGTVDDGKTVVQMIDDAKTAATYDDTAIANRIKSIEDDYLKSTDKSVLTTAIAAAKSEAINEAIAAIVGTGTSEDFDTLKEIADWILSDTTGAASLITRITAIENDYLKGADKTSLQESIDALETLIGELPSDCTSTNVIAYIQEAIAGIKIGDYAKAAELTALTTRVTNIESEITSLTEALEGKVDKVDGSRLLTEAEAAKLEKLVISEDGSVEISGTIAAGNVEGLADWITARAANLKGLSENNLTDVLKQQILNSQANVIEVVKVGGTAITVNSADKSIEIPGALQESLGVVKGTTVENGISIADDHTMSVNSLNVNKLVQTDGDTFVLDGGSSAD